MAGGRSGYRPADRWAPLVKTSKSQRLSKEDTGAGLSRTGGIEEERLTKKNDNVWGLGYNLVKNLYNMHEAPKSSQHTQVSQHLGGGGKRSLKLAWAI